MLRVRMVGRERSGVPLAPAPTRQCGRVFNLLGRKRARSKTPGLFVAQLLHNLLYRTPRNVPEPSLTII